MKLFLFLLIVLGFSFSSDFERCIQLANKGKYEQAISLAEELIRDPKKQVGGYYCLAIVSSNIGNYRTAVLASKKAYSLSEDPLTKFHTVSFLVKVLLRAGYTDEAEKYLNEEVKIYRKLEKRKEIKFRVLIDIALFYDYKGDLEKAEKFYKEALQYAKDEDLLSIYNNLALIYNARKDYDGAIQFINKAMRIAERLGDPSQKGIYLLNAGKIYMNAGDLSSAKKFILEGLKFVKDFGYWKVVGLFYLGQVYINEGDYAKAISTLKEAKKLARDLQLANIERSIDNLIEVAIAKREDIYITAGAEGQVIKVAILKVVGKGDRLIKVSAERVRNRKDLSEILKVLNTLRKGKNVRKFEALSYGKEVEGFSDMELREILAFEFKNMIPKERQGESVLLRIGYNSTHLVYFQNGDLRVISVPYGMINAAHFSREGADFYKFMEFLIEDEFYQAVVFEGGRYLKRKKYLYLSGDIGVVLSAILLKDTTPFKRVTFPISGVKSVVEKLRREIGEIYDQKSVMATSHLDLYELYAGAYILKGVMKLIGKEEVHYLNYGDWVSMKAFLSSLR